MKTLKISRVKTRVWSAALLLAVAGGCSKAPDSASQPVGPDARETDARIQAIQNDASLSPEAKQKAIEMLKSRQVAPSTAR